MSAPPGTPLDTPLGATWPDLDGFRTMAADRRVVPVVRRYLADGETPVGLYRRLSADRTGSFLLESAEHDGSWSRWSIIGVRSAAVLTSRGPGPDDGCWVGQPPAGLPLTGDPLAMLRETLRVLRTPRVPGMPPLTSGMVGVLGWDVVHRWERLPRRAVDDLHLPELVLCLATDLAVVDHRDATVWLVANAVNHDGSDERVDEAYADAVRRLDAMEADLARPAPTSVTVQAGGGTHGAAGPVTAAEPRSTTTQEQFHAMVDAGKEAIRDGEVFQVVLSQRFSVPTELDALSLYRALRLTNPSPYMYLVRLEGPDGERFDVVGSSPEALVTVEDGTVISHPIAGTRPRSGDPTTDAERAEDLLADPKERAEHLMLVDLARNDLGRVCEPGTVDVVEFMQIERFSHVLHIVSTVTGRLRADADQVDVLTATFPAGTLSGAPKVRAVELIDELEPTRRGVYGGVVGYLDLAGDLDLAIAIRTGVLAGGTLHVQAGGGIVADSTPHGEYEESRTKSAAVLAAHRRAADLRPLDGGQGPGAL
ncbi:anthranilate synthase component I [Aquipuribacter nitratireducens]|uniref:Anthranilate synthase component 1 n=1 Tax=Aquipuribacter nitratireducens TaxID=650104 RepID=A0ABW0GT59_9MICO